MRTREENRLSLKIDKRLRKLCPHCAKKLSLDNFHIHKVKKDNLRGWCKECVKKDNKDRIKRYSKNNEQYWNNYMKDYYHNRETPENREHRLEHMREYLKKYFANRKINKFTF